MNPPPPPCVNCGCVCGTGAGAEAGAGTPKKPPNALEVDAGTLGAGAVTAGIGAVTVGAGAEPKREKMSVLAEEWAVEVGVGLGGGRGAWA